MSLIPFDRALPTVAARELACGTWDHRDDPAWQDSVWPQLERTPTVASVPAAVTGGCLCPACLSRTAAASQRTA